MSDPLGTGLMGAVRCPVWMLGNKLRCFGRTSTILTPEPCHLSSPWDTFLGLDFDLVHSLFSCLFKTFVYVFRQGLFMQTRLAQNSTSACLSKYQELWVYAIISGLCPFFVIGFHVSRAKDDLQLLILLLLPPVLSVELQTPPYKGFVFLAFTRKALIFFFDSLDRGINQ